MTRVLSMVTLLALALFAAPLASEAQRGRNVAWIGWLTSSVLHTANVEAFRQGMHALGYRDLKFEFRAAAGRMEQLPTLAAELVALQVDVIVTDGGPAVRAAKEATATIPIVIGATGIDLVRQGLVESLARPGGNVTGLTISTGAELYGKRLELLRDAIPGLDRVSVMGNARNEGTRMWLPVVEAAAKTLGVQLTHVQASDGPGIERAFRDMVRGRTDAVLTLADAFLWSQRAQIVALATRHRLPGIYPEAEFAEAGGLLAYGPKVPDNFRRAATYVDKILKGAKPADLPVEQPTKFELVINLKTAKALGLTIPPAVLARADDVIQ
jgi:putative ABC transport system substrate-binding protein